MPRTRPILAPESLEIKRGLSHLWAGLHVSGDAAYETVFIVVREVMWNGAAVRDGARAVGRALAGRDWHWPWMETWAAEFQALDIWPRSWTNLGIERPLLWGAIEPQTRLELLVGTIEHAVYTARRIRQTREMQEDGLNSDTEVELITDDGLCPAGQLMLERHAAAIAARRYESPPPYFPGDPKCLRWAFRDS